MQADIKSSKKIKFLRRFSSGKALKSLDFFSKPIPAFNIRGKTKLSSPGGTFVSLVVIAVMFLYTMTKLQILLVAENPVISQFRLEDALDLDTELNLQE